MRYLQVIGLIASMALFGCADTNEIGRTGKREQANREAARQRLGQADESQQNLQNAQQALINRDGNSTRQSY